LLRACNDARDSAECERTSEARITIEFESRRVSRESLSSSLSRLRTQQQQVLERAAQLDLELSGAEPAMA